MVMVNPFICNGSGKSFYMQWYVNPFMCIGNGEFFYMQWYVNPFISMVCIILIYLMHVCKSF